MTDFSTRMTAPSGDQLQPAAEPPKLVLKRYPVLRPLSPQQGPLLLPGDFWEAELAPEREQRLIEQGLLGPGTPVAAAKAEKGKKHGNADS